MYDPATGVFTWREAVLKRKAGSIAGGVDGKGYQQIRIGGSIFRSHRLAFLAVTGSWPKDCVDHMNGVRGDNRWENLRDVPPVENSQNQRRPRSDSTSGFLGVSPRKTKRTWQAQIRVKGKILFLGYFKTPEEGHEVYLAAKRRLHAGCTI